MNIAFTKLIKIRSLLREVNFRKLPHMEAAYHVDLTDERGTRYMFSMLRDADGLWKLSSGALPTWISEAEKLLSGAIEEQEASQGLDTKKTA